MGSMEEHRSRECTLSELGWGASQPNIQEGRLGLCWGWGRAVYSSVLQGTEDQRPGHSL